MQFTPTLGKGNLTARKVSSQLLGTGLLLGLGLLTNAAHGQAPVVAALSPLRNAVAAPRATPVVVTFNQPLSSATATQQALKVFSQQAGGKKAGTSSVSGSTLRFAPTAPFKAGETVFATVTTAVRTNNDQPLAQPQVFQFTTAVTRSAGVFIPGSDPAVGSSPADVAVGDVDGDGDLDLLATASTTGTVSVRLNNGSGSFSGTQQVSVGSQPYGLALGDVDSDGDLDILVTLLNSSAVSIRLNNGTGTFSGTSQVAVGFGPTTLTLADVDGDGDLDLLAANTENTLSVRLNNGAGTFSGGSEVSVGNAPFGLAVGDVDNDGDVDVLAASFGSLSVSVRLNNGAGVFTGNQNVSLPLYTPTDLAVGDLDGDGDLDFAATGTSRVGSSGVASVHLNNGSGAFGGGALLAVGTQPSGIVLGDTDGDGDLDLAVSNSGANTVSVRVNNGQGTFSGNAEVAVGGQPVDLALGDVDNNNTLDIITANAQASTASVRLNSQVLATAAAAKTQPLGLYPNPARASVRLQLPTGFNGQATQVRVLNALGQEVVAQRLQGATLDLALPSLAPGIYTVQLATNQGNLASRLVVE